eukprot:1095812_1
MALLQDENVDPNPDLFDKDLYKQKLKELSKFDSPTHVFYNIDTLFLLYGSIKREYNASLKNVHSHKKKIKASLEQALEESATDPAPVSLKEISQQLHMILHVHRSIAKMKEVEAKFNQWRENFFDVMQRIEQNKIQTKSECKNEVSPSSSQIHAAKTISRQNTAPSLFMNARQQSTGSRYRKKKRRKKKLFLGVHSHSGYSRTPGGTPRSQQTRDNDIDMTQTRDRASTDIFQYTNTRLAAVAQAKSNPNTKQMTGT